MKWYIIAAAICITQALGADASDEALFVRRITEFHKDKESFLVKAQICEFLKQYPHSDFLDSLMVILADTYWSEHEYGKARETYESITSAKLRDSVQDHYIDTLYRLGDYPSTAEAVSKITGANLRPLHRLYYAEAQRQLAKHDPQLVEDAIYAYEGLLDSEHANEARAALAELHAQHRDYTHALKYYLELVDCHPERRAEFRLKAAQLKAADDPQGVIDMLSEDQSSEARLIVGRSHFVLQHYKEAYESLAPLASTIQGNDNALLCMLVVCAYHLNQPEQVEAWAERFEFSYPDDAALAHIWHIRALTHCSANNFMEAQRYFEMVIDRDRSFEHRDAALHELAILLYKQQDYMNSREKFLQLVNEHPESNLSKNAWKYIPQSTLQMIGTSNEANLKQQLVNDLMMLLNADNAILPSERPKYQFKLCKTLHDLQRYAEAESQLHVHLAENPTDADLFQAHLLLAMCAQHTQNDPTDFIKHAEMSLALKPDQPDRSRLQLNLFSAYLKQAYASGNPALFDKAADILFSVIQNGEEAVKEENQLWLANHFYNKVKEPSREYVPDPLINEEKAAFAAKAALVFRTALQDKLAAGISQNSLYLEYEIYKLSNLYGWLGQPHEQESVLKQLAEWQEDHSSWPWGLRNRTQFALAYALYRQEFYNQALRIFQLLNEQKGVDPRISGFSRLLQARLSFLVLPDAEKTLESERALAILKTLKDLQIRKALANEPIHLEAALDYVAMRSSLEPPEKRLENTRFLLQRAKESFTCRDDLCSRDYQAARAELPEKERIYQAYMMLIDAHIANTEAEIANNKGDTTDRDLRADVAKEIYENLLKEKFAVSKYLIDQAQSGLHSVASEKLYEYSIYK